MSRLPPQQQQSRMQSVSGGLFGPFNRCTSAVDGLGWSHRRDDDPPDILAPVGPGGRMDDPGKDSGAEAPGPKRCVRTRTVSISATPSEKAWRRLDRGMLWVLKRLSDARVMDICGALYLIKGRCAVLVWDLYFSLGSLLLVAPYDDESYVITMKSKTNTNISRSPLPNIYILIYYTPCYLIAYAHRHHRRHRHHQRRHHHHRRHRRHHCHRHRRCRHH